MSRNRDSKNVTNASELADRPLTLGNSSGRRMSADKSQQAQLPPSSHPQAPLPTAAPVNLPLFKSNRIVRSPRLNSFDFFRQPPLLAGEEKREVAVTPASVGSEAKKQQI